MVVSDSVSLVPLRQPLTGIQADWEEYSWPSFLTFCSLPTILACWMVGTTDRTNSPYPPSK